MQGQQICQQCERANAYNNTNHQQFNFYIICLQGHFLCRQCYQQISYSQCPFEHGGSKTQLLSINIPVKAFKLGPEQIQIEDQAAQLIKSRNRIKMLENNIQELRRKPRGQEFAQKRSQELAKLNEEIQQIKKEKSRQQEKLKHLQERRRLANFILFMVSDTILALLQITSTVLQFLIMFSSINTTKFEMTAFVFYLITLLLTLMLVHIKYGLTSYLQYFFLIIIFPLFFLKLVFTNHYKRWNQYFSNDSADKSPLTFNNINFSFLIGKVIVFLIYFARYYDTLESYVTRTALIVALICSDISYSISNPPLLK